MLHRPIGRPIRPVMEKGFGYRPRAAAAPAVSPLNSSLVRISAQSVAGLADGATVTAVTNQGTGGSTYNAANGTLAAPTKQTLAGKPVILYSTGATTGLLLNTAITPGSSFSVFMVGQQTVNRLIAFGSTTGSTYFGYWQNNGTGVLIRNDVDVGLDLSGLTSVAGLKAFGVVVNAGNITYYDNSTTGVTTGSITGTINYNGIGTRTGQYSDGYLAESIYCNTALSNTDAQSMMTNLKTLYGIA